MVKEFLFIQMEMFILEIGQMIKKKEKKYILINHILNVYLTIIIKKIKRKLIWNDGSYYEREILNNKFNGYEIYFWKEGRNYKGIWNNGEIEGKGIFTNLDGSLRRRFS